jgi:inner membrane protein
MDSLTHILTGIAVGQVFSGEKDKSRPLIWGAIAGSIPDLDTVIQPFLSPESSILFHRGLSHSLFLWALCSPLLALLVNKIYKGDRRSYFKWLKICVIAWFSHIFLDVFNTYGTGIFEPFSDTRISYDAINVYDLMYLIPVLTLSIFFVFVIEDYMKKVTVAALSITFSLLYIIFAVSVKLNTEINAQTQFLKQNIYPVQASASPLPLSSLAWQVIVEYDEGYYIGVYYGFWKSKTVFKYVSKNEHLEQDFINYDSFRKLQRFSKNRYTLEQIDGQVFMNDLRFTSLEEGKSALSIPLHVNENSPKIGRTLLNRRITFKNIKEHWRQLLSNQDIYYFEIIRRPNAPKPAYPLENSIR